MSSDKANNPTPIEKQYIAALLEAGPEGEFGISFMNSMKEKVEKGYSLTISQHTTLEGMYDKVILGNQTERTRYDFGICTIDKVDNSKWLWSLSILGQQYGDNMPKKDALVLGSWLAKILPVIAEDFKQDDTMADRIISYDEMKASVTKVEEEKDPPKALEPKEEDPLCEDCPF